MGQWAGAEQVLKSSLGQVDDERVFLIKMLIRNRGNILKTAHELGVNRTTIYKQIKIMGLWPHVNRARRERLVMNAVNRAANI